MKVAEDVLTMVVIDGWLGKVEDNMAMDFSDFEEVEVIGLRGGNEGTEGALDI